MSSFARSLADSVGKDPWLAGDRLGSEAEWLSKVVSGVDCCFRTVEEEDIVVSAVPVGGVAEVCGVVGAETELSKACVELERFLLLFVIVSSVDCSLEDVGCLEIML